MIDIMKVYLPQAQTSLPMLFHLLLYLTLAQTSLSMLFYLLMYLPQAQTSLTMLGILVKNLHNTSFKNCVLLKNLLIVTA